MTIRTQDDLLRAVKEIYRESMKLRGEDPEVFPRDERWVTINQEDGSILKWDTKLTAIFKQGGKYTIPVEVVWKMPTFHAWYSSDDQKLMNLWHNFMGFLLRILGDPKKIEGGLEFVDVVSQLQKADEEPRWKQRRRNLRSDFPMKK